MNRDSSPGFFSSIFGDFPRYPDWARQHTPNINEYKKARLEWKLKRIAAALGGAGLVAGAGFVAAPKITEAIQGNSNPGSQRTTKAESTVSPQTTEHPKTPLVTMTPTVAATSLPPKPTSISPANPKETAPTPENPTYYKRQLIQEREKNSILPGMFDVGLNVAFDTGKNGYIMEIIGVFSLVPDSPIQNEKTNNGIVRSFVISLSKDESSKPYYYHIFYTTERDRTNPNKPPAIRTVAYQPIPGYSTLDGGADIFQLSYGQYPGASGLQIDGFSPTISTAKASGGLDPSTPKQQPAQPATGQQPKEPVPAPQVESTSEKARIEKNVLQSLGGRPPIFDISLYQNSKNGFDLSKLNPQPSMVIIKSSQAAGEKGINDPMYPIHLENAKKLGISISAYHLVRPDLGYTAEEEADFFYRKVKSEIDKNTFKYLALDLEFYGGDATNLPDYCVRFFKRLKDNGYSGKTFLYINLATLAQYSGHWDKVQTTADGLWVAAYSRNPGMAPNIDKGFWRGWKSVLFQFTDQPGIGGYIHGLDTSRWEVEPKDSSFAPTLDRFGRPANWKKFGGIKSKVD